MNEKTPKKKVAAFNDPVIHRKAVENAKGKPRPNRKSVRKLTEEVKKEAIREDLIKSGYMEMVHNAIPKVVKAHIELASKPKSTGTQERKLMFQAVGLIGKEQKEAAQTIADVLADIFSNPTEDDE